MENTTIKSFSISEMKDKYIGKTGTVRRDKYEYKVRMDVIKKNQAND